MESSFTEHQLAGLNGGHGRGWTDVVPCTGVCAKRSKGYINKFKDLVTRVGSDVKGRYIQVVNNETIVRGGCLPDGLKNVEMEVYPRQAGMFGGEMLAVSAVCREPSTKIFCRFNFNEAMRTEGVMETKMRGRCPVPILTVRDRVTIELSTDNMSWMYKTTIAIILPSRLPPPVYFPMNEKAAWYEINPRELKVRWLKDMFSSSSVAKLNINLIGYREDKTCNGDKVCMWHVERLASNVLNSAQQHTIQPSQFSCKSECDELQLAIVQIEVASEYVDPFTKYQKLNFGPVPVGWYVNNALTAKYGQDWPGDKCKAWNAIDQQRSGWLENLLPCPCTLSQAMADWGRWQPDTGCSVFSGSACYYHQDAIHCVRSVHPTQDGSGNQCCYQRDGTLLYAADTYQGSTPDRSHDWGAVPYGTPDRVPSLSHWLHDVVTFYYCCLWTEYQHCHIYMDRRPTRDCTAYELPHYATVFGNAHLITFDGKSYHFGGSGDFWILQSNTLNIQGRFEERDNKYLLLDIANQLAPTNLTSIVMWIGDSDVVTVRKSPPGGVTNRSLDILVGSQRHFFNSTSEMWQDFKGVSITSNANMSSKVEDTSHSNFTVMFQGGAAVNVAERRGLLHLVVVLPPNTGKTKGLLGTLDGNPDNDFTNAHGEVIGVFSQPDILYIDFAMTWNVSTTSGESRFHWPKAASPKVPLFGDPPNFFYRPEMQDQKPMQSEVFRVCRHSKPCERDYFATADSRLAINTAKADGNYQALRKLPIVRSCGLLDIPMAVKSTTNYTEGSVVKVTGCRPNNAAVINPDAPTVYTCSKSSSASVHPAWSPEPVKDMCPHAQEQVSAQKASDTGMIVGIVVGVIVVIVIVVVVVIIVRRKKSGDESSAQPVPAKRTTVPTDVVIEPGTDEKLLRNRPRDGDQGPVKMSEVGSRTENV